MLEKHFDLKDLVKIGADGLKRRVGCYKKMNEVATFIENLPYIQNESCSCKYDEFYAQYYSILTYRIYDADYEDIIENVAGPIHQKFDVYWMLEVENNETLVLKGKTCLEGGVNVMLRVNPPKDSCRIVSKIIRLKTDEELEAERAVQKYYIVCDEE